MPNPVNLKELYTTDSDNTLLDKINYNFDQLIDHQGPKGETGEQGFQGPQGQSGPMGPQGDIGVQGPVGADGVANEEYWTKPSSEAEAITTIFPISSGTNAPNVVIGYSSADANYDQPLSGAQLQIHKDAVLFDDHIRLTAFRSGTLANEMVSRIRLADYSNVQTFEIQTDEGNISLNADTINLKNGGTTTLSITSGLTTAESDSFTINSTTTTIETDDLVLNTKSPQGGYIAASFDSQGTVVWINPIEKELNLPVGTIIQLLPSLFDDTNFYLNETGADPEQLRFGAGKGIYAGWYLCHGFTWTDGTTGFTTPDLSSFSIELDDSPFLTQGNIQLVAGGDVFMSATEIGGLYSIEDSVDTNVIVDVELPIGTPNFDVHKLVHIIYLADSGLYWNLNE